MAGSHTIFKLTQTYARLLGKYEFIEREIEQVSGVQNMLREINRIERDKRAMLKQLDAIATTAKLIDPTWTREAVQPISPYKTDRNSKLIGITVWKVLRDTDTPLRTREISRRVAAILEMELCERELARLDPPIHTMLKSKVGKTILMSSKRPIQWSLMPRDQVRSLGKHTSLGSSAHKDAAAQR